MTSTSSRFNVAVFGASGGLGKNVVIQAVSAGHSVVAVVRSASKLKNLFSSESDVSVFSKITVIEAEVTDRAKLVSALTENKIDAVIVASHLIVKDVVAAATEAKVPRISISGGAPALIADGRLAWEALGRAYGRDYRGLSRVHCENYLELQLAGIQQEQDGKTVTVPLSTYVSVCPGYMTEQPILPDDQIITGGETFIPLAKTPLPYANCAKVMVETLQPDYVFANKRVAITTKS